jgi:hypothetical protein
MCYKVKTENRTTYVILDFLQVMLRQFVYLRKVGQIDIVRHEEAETLGRYIFAKPAFTVKPH